MVLTLLLLLKGAFLNMRHSGGVAKESGFNKKSRKHSTSGWGPLDPWEGTFARDLSRCRRDGHAESSTAAALD